MKLTNCLPAAIAIAFVSVVFWAAPVNGRAANLADELLDATHDMRAQAELKQEVIPSWEAPISDTSVTHSGSPFTQGVNTGYTIEDNAPDLEVGSVKRKLTSLEDLSDE